MAIRSATFLLGALTLAAPVALQAQYGRGGVGHSGGIPHPGAGPQVPRAGGAGTFARPGIGNPGGRPYGIRTDIPTPIGLNPPAASYTGILPGAYKQSNGFGRGGRGGGGAFLSAPLYYPYLGYDSTAASFPSYNETIDPNAQAFAAAQESLGEQIRQLTADLASMKQQLSAPVPPEPLPSVPPSPAATAAADVPSTDRPPVAVVLKDGQTLSVQSYAVMNGFLWDFSKQPARKIAVSTIDVPASVKASEANGTEFPEITPAR